MVTDKKGSERWKSVTPRRPRTRVRSQETCPVCGARYERFRCGRSFESVQEELLTEARARVDDAQDYSKPVRLRAILGRLHEHKLYAWKYEHLYWCAQEHDEAQGHGEAQRHGEAQGHGEAQRHGEAQGHDEAQVIGEVQPGDGSVPF